VRLKRQLTEAEADDAASNSTSTTEKAFRRLTERLRSSSTLASELLSRSAAQLRSEFAWHAGSLIHQPLPRESQQRNQPGE
jgi:hypothetical protein